MLMRSHEQVEIHRRSATYRSVKHSVDIIRSALEWLHLISFSRQQCHKSYGYRCLARSRRGSRYHKSFFHIQLINVYAKVRLFIEIQKKFKFFNSFAHFLQKLSAFVQDIKIKVVTLQPNEKD